MLKVYYVMDINVAQKVVPDGHTLPDMHDRNLVVTAEVLARKPMHTVITCRDIFVRCILRMVKQGDLPLDQLEIYFVDYQGSVQKLNVNERGQVNNHPDGFMDEYLKEAYRWMTAYDNFFEG